MLLSIITVSVAPLLILLHMSYEASGVPSSSLVPSPHHTTGCRQPIAIMPQPPALLWLDPAFAVYAAASMVRIGDAPPIFSLTAWRPHSNDKAASPASRVQQP